MNAEERTKRRAVVAVHKRHVVDVPSILHVTQSKLQGMDHIRSRQANAPNLKDRQVRKTHPYYLYVRKFIVGINRSRFTHARNRVAKDVTWCRLRERASPTSHEGWKTSLLLRPTAFIGYRI